MNFQQAPIQDPLGGANNRMVNASTWVLWLKKLVDFIVAPTVNFIKFDTNYTGTVPTTEGTLSWNNTDHTLNIQSEISDSVLQVGQEFWLRGVNKTGSTITDGQAVYVSGAQGNRPKISLAQGNADSTSYVIGVATAHILNNAEGYVTLMGRVGTYNTSGFTAGDFLYLSPTVAGALTNVRPTAPNHGVKVAIALNSTNNGSIYVNPEIGYELDELHDVKITSVADGNILQYDSTGPYWKNSNVFGDNMDPTGFLDQDNVGVAYNSANRTITLTHASGTIYYYYRGIKKSLTSPWTSSAHSVTTGARYFLYSTDGINFNWSTTVWNFYDVMVSVVTYYAADKFALREVHGSNMTWSSHEEFHRTIGTYRESGGAIGGYTLASTTPAFRRPTVDPTVVHDEDIMSTITALPTGTYTQVTLTGSGTTTFTTVQAEIVPILVNNPYYNSFTIPNWGQTLMANNSYMSVWLVAVPTSSDAGSLAYRYLWVQGQTNGSLASQQSLSPSSLNLGTLTGAFTEFVFIGQVIIRYQGGNWDLTDVISLSTTRGGVSGAAGAFLSAVTTDATLTGIGTAGSPLSMNTVTETIATTAGNTGTAALPATPAGFITRTFNGTAYKIPIYPV